MQSLVSENTLNFFHFNRLWYYVLSKNHYLKSIRFLINFKSDMTLSAGIFDNFLAQNENPPLSSVIYLFVLSRNLFSVVRPSRDRWCSSIVFWFVREKMSYQLYNVIAIARHNHRYILVPESVPNWLKFGKITWKHSLFTLNIVSNFLNMLCHTLTTI